ncbi:MAG: VCBS repeat-containing protein, partial [Myxococcales bacterium]|nr:VCBS repeat-containing protein [Myxococcales bacterium]
MRSLDLRLLRPTSVALATLVLGAAALVSHGARAAWPPAPGADMRDKANWPNDFNARWNYISYFPERKTQSPLLDADIKLGAAGMSIDRAWTETIGSDEVRIAVIDSGVHWENADLVNKAWLNAGELGGTKKPQDAQGQPCGGAGALAGYDCNGDGMFTVADYRDDPRFAGAVPGEKCFADGERTKLSDKDRIKGDLNRNCILDPGDLILMFSDGVDDDANGYTDDISGWDFFKNDNDPYDDTRYGHGTGEARDSTAEANNGSGDPGVCPGCRFIPLRVGDSFITDSNVFGKAVVYAADNGAKVVQEALGTINQTTFSRAAIDYAYGKGLIVVASMADENSRHHNMPGTANHVLTVHSIRYDEQKPETSSTFLAFDTCSNYGGHLSLSVSGTSCSSEATGRGSGIAGLLYSMAAKEKLQLTAEEAIQIFKMYADDVDVAESRGERPVYYFSKAGFDQRFGYGRANAFRMVEAVKARLIPPEVDIVSPEWFSVLYADRTSGPVPIMGRVAAARAPSYDFKVEWAPGVQPEEGDYKPLAPPLVNVPGATVSGGAATPLAQIDPRQIDTSHPRDPDSPLGENDRSISVRVQAVAHYPNGDVRGEARRVVAIVNDKNGGDPDLLPGFPISLGSSAEGSPKLADIDGDGVRDIIQPTTDGKLHVLTLKSGRPEEVAGFPYLTRIDDGLNKDLGATEPTVPSYLAGAAYKAGAAGGIDPTTVRESLMNSPAIGDLDGDGKPEIVVATWPGTIYVVNSKGQDLPGWPKRLPLVPSCSLDPSKPSPPGCMDYTHGFARGVYGAPVLADMDKDGKPEIIIGAFDGNIYVYKLDGTVLDGFPVALASKASDTPRRIMSTPTVVDLNGDGIPEIVSGSNQQIGGGGNAGPVFVVDGRGNKAPGGPYLPNWPITMTSLSLFPVVAEGITSSQAAADFDGDGRPDILVQGNGAPPLVLKADPGAQPG